MIKIRMYKIRLNQGGYDSTGRYWGTGLPLYHYEFEINGQLKQFEMRAPDRQAAQEIILKTLESMKEDFTFYGPFTKTNEKQADDRFKRNN